MFRNSVDTKIKQNRFHLAYFMVKSKQEVERIGLYTNERPCRYIQMSNIQTNLLILQDSICQRRTTRNHCITRCQRHKRNIITFEHFLCTEPFARMSYVVLYELIWFLQSHEKTCRGTLILLRVQLSVRSLVQLEVLQF